MSKGENLDLVERLATIPYTGAISDILDEMGLTNQTLPKEIQALQPGQTLAGRALLMALALDGDGLTGRTRLLGAW